VAKTALLPGAELEALTPAEFKAYIDELVIRLFGDEGVMRDEGFVNLDASGNGVIKAYTVPQGMNFNLHRVVIDVEGFTPGAPFTNAAGWIDVNRGGDRQDFLPLAATVGGIPAVWAQSGDAAIRYRNGESVEISINGGPASRDARAKIQGTLKPLTVT
jgi:hypothetical protein